MSSPYTISVITPSYNSSKYIDETIFSVLSQRGPFKIQYVIIDGGSTDKTLSIIERHARRVAEGCYAGYCQGIDFSYISEADSGMYDAISKGLKALTGDICCYINSDDFYLPNSFRSVVAVFHHYKTVNWITGIPNFYNSFGGNFRRYVPFDYDSKLIQKGAYGSQLKHIQQESVFWRRSLLDCIDLGQLSSYKLAGDFYMWHEFSKKNTLWTVDSILSGFRTHEANLSADLTRYNEEFNRIKSSTLTLCDKLKILKHKYFWQLPFEKKRHNSKTLISLSRPKLLSNFSKYERSVLNRSAPEPSHPSA